MIRFDDILEKVQDRLEEKDLAVLRKAYVFSAQAHKGQIRRSGEPYLSHPLEVTALLADLGLDRTTLVAGLLHDVLEDTDDHAGRAPGDLRQRGRRARRGRDQDQPGPGSLARDPAGRDDPQDHPGHDRRHAGHLHQAGRPAPQPPDAEVPLRPTRSAIAAETLEIYAPIANRLGMGRIKAELEDLAFRYVEPDAYFRMAALIDPAAQDGRSGARQAPPEARSAC